MCVTEKKKQQNIRINNSNSLLPWKSNYHYVLMLQNYKEKWSQSSFLGTSKTTLETKDFVHILRIFPSLSFCPSFPFPFLLKWLYFNICNAYIQWISNEIYFNELGTLNICDCSHGCIARNLNICHGFLLLFF